MCLYLNYIFLHILQFSRISSSYYVDDDAIMSSAIPNFGWGRNLEVGKAREGSFYLKSVFLVSVI